MFRQTPSTSTITTATTTATTIAAATTTATTIAAATTSAAIVAALPVVGRRVTPGRRRGIGVATTTLAACLLLMAALRPATATSPVPSDPRMVNVWLTTPDHRNLLAPQPGLRFGGDGSNGSNAPLTIHVDERRTYQQVAGFGASLTDTSAWLLYVRLDAVTRARVMRDVFDPSAGIGVNVLRQPIGASDFTYDATSYSLDDVPRGQKDPALANFSAGHDVPYIVTALQDALLLNPSLKIMATPWSPPAWMKNFGGLTGRGGSLSPTAYAPLAAYFVRFIQAYREQGVPIDALTLQNEPGYTTPDYPGMRFNSAQERHLLVDYLAPALQAAGLHPKLLIYDDRWGLDRRTDHYPWRILGDRQGNPLIAGTAYHCYYGSPDVMTELHLAYPRKDIYETECSGGQIAPGPVAELAINALRNWSRSVVLWNVAMDTRHGPRQGSGCTNCLGLVTVDQASGAVSYTDNYYQLGQVSRFVHPGAYRIDSNTFGAGSYGSGTLEDVAFKNPDGSKALVAYNAARASRTFRVQWGGQGFSYTLPGGAMATFVWSGAQQGASVASTPVEYAIDAGGMGTGAGPGGIFLPDSYADAGRGVTVRLPIDACRADDPAPLAIYQSMRLGPEGFTYTLPNLRPGARYGVRLHFAELLWPMRGERRFNVLIGGRRVLHDFDIVAAAGGRRRAVVKSFETTASGDGTISIAFTRGAADYPAVNGIAVRRITPGQSHAMPSAPPYPHAPRCRAGRP